jgi:alpha-beta hydrolase superfamily lysophospholipase
MGYEYMHSYRTLLHMADALAARGLPTVRFDYGGSGSSPGDAMSPRLLETWTNDIHAAAALLENITGEAPSLLGLSLGATLAGLAASRSTVRHFVGWAPVISGRRYVRELEALVKIAGIQRPQGVEFIEAGGFMLSDETARDLKSVDLGKLQFRIEGQVLVLERDDLTTSSGLSGVMSGQGLEVDVEVAQDYTKMMDEPHYTVVPHSTIERIALWLSDRASGSGAGSLSTLPPAVRTQSRSDSGGAEQFVQLRGNHELFAVHTTSSKERSNAPLLVLVNSGSVHQVGPNRVYVELARHLQAAGFPTLRVDLRNLGDSIRGRSSNENHPYPETMIDDLSRFLEWAGDVAGYERIVVAGICSGAHAAFKSGMQLANERLKGALIINPLTFHWHEGLSLRIPPAFQTLSELSYYQGAMRDPRKWAGLLRGQADIRGIWKFLGRYTRDTVGRVYTEALERTGIRAPGRLAMELGEYEELGRRADFVFSRSDPGYNILMHDARRTVRRLRGRGLTSVTFIERADHTFSLAQWRSELAHAVTACLERYSST